MDQTNKDFMDKIYEMTRKTDAEIKKIIEVSQLEKHSDLRTLLMEELELTYGFANTLVHIMTKSDGASQAEGKSMSEVLNEIYKGKKSQFRPIHEALMKEINGFGAFEILPKRGYISLKRNRQFAMIGPKTNTRMEIGINLKDYVGTTRLVEQAKGSMCKFIVKLTKIEEVDSELLTWLKEAFDQSE